MLRCIYDFTLRQQRYCHIILSIHSSVRSTKHYTGDLLTDNPRTDRLSVREKWFNFGPHCTNSGLWWLGCQKNDCDRRLLNMIPKTNKYYQQFGPPVTDESVKMAQIRQNFTYSPVDVAWRRMWWWGGHYHENLSLNSFQTCMMTLLDKLTDFYLLC